MKKQQKLLSKNPLKLSIFTFFIGLVIVSVYVARPYLNHDTVTGTKLPEQTILNQELSNSNPVKNGTFRIFTGPEFANLYNNFAYPNTKFIDEYSVITGDQKTDNYIKNLAEDKGYKKRSAPVSNTFQDLGKGILLQQRAVEPWKDMQNAAKSEGIEIYLTAGFRSATDQKTIFIENAAIHGVNLDKVTSQNYDDKLNDLLSTTSIPGYSRHHTGYTIDIGCSGQNEQIFGSSLCFVWISKNNYQNAKKFGWIPSYPDGAGKQGPNPEPWEYVWVGTDALTE